MTIFDGKKVYGGNWTVADSRSFNADEINAVSTANVVASEYGSSVCFHMKSGGMCFIPLSNTSSLSVGDSVDMTKAKLLTLERSGSADIVRVDA
jgi:hypothetical protein